mmetsp:Transcript_12136/g.28330  ORF Transcript_12136/g.28330 Transcript_12136/m.28330 type:complete len:631 (+) Transcript_12136:75-1967(+)
MSGAKELATASLPKVAFQGERGAYSEQAILEFFGGQGIVEPVGHKTFDEAFAACRDGQTDLVMVPIENTLGGTVHPNYDLQLRHNMFIIGEHDFRVRHSLLALPGTSKASLKKVISHQQALAQCDTYLSMIKVPGEASYDTAGSAKLIREGNLEGVGCICSELAAQYYNLEVLDRGIEDDYNNYTRFLLLRSDPAPLPKGVECKTSIVFSLENVAGALFKALSVFSLRDIDLTRIESRPCKPDVMDRLERMYWSMGGVWSTFLTPPQLQDATQGRQEVVLKKPSPDKARFRYLFYVDFLASIEEPRAVKAMQHLQEITNFFRVLGCYPCAVEKPTTWAGDILKPKQPAGGLPKRTVAILGFGNFGQFLAKRMVSDFDVIATSRSDNSQAAKELGVEWLPNLDAMLDREPDVLLISVSILSFEAMMKRVRASMDAVSAARQAKDGSPIVWRTLVVDVLSVKVHAKSTLMALMPDTCDILCTHPMFGPESGRHSWRGLPFVYERVRLFDTRRCEDFLKWWSGQGLRMVDMTCEQHDEYAAGSQFVTHFTGRSLNELGLRTTPINTKGFDSLLQLVDVTCRDSQDLFVALYKYNPNAEEQLQAMEKAVAEVSKGLRSIWTTPGEASGAKPSGS